MADSKITLRKFIKLFPTYFSDMIGLSVIMSLFFVGLIIFTCFVNEVVIFNIDFNLFSVYGVPISGGWIFLLMLFVAVTSEVKKYKHRKTLRVIIEVISFAMMLYGAINSGNIELFNGTIVSLSTIMYICLGLFVLFASIIFWGNISLNDIYTGKRTFTEIEIPAKFTEDNKPYSIWIEDRDFKGLYSLKEAKSEVSKQPDGLRLLTKREALFIVHFTQYVNPRDDLRQKYSDINKTELEYLTYPSGEILDSAGATCNIPNASFTLFNERDQYWVFPLSGIKKGAEIEDKGVRTSYWLDESSDDNPISLSMYVIKSREYYNSSIYLSNEVPSNDKISIRFVSDHNITE